MQTRRAKVSIDGLLVCNWFLRKKKKKIDSMDGCKIIKLSKLCLLNIMICLAK